MSLFQPMKDREAADELVKQYHLMRRRQHKRHMQWLETMSSIHGEQYRILRGNRMVDVRQLRGDDVDSFRVTHNFMYQAFRSMMATALQQEPTPVVALSRPGKEGRQLAMVCEKLLTYLYYEAEFREALQTAVGWSFTCGTGFLGTMWDMRAGHPQWVPDMDEHGNFMFKTTKQLMEGEDGKQVLSEYGTPLTEDVLKPSGSMKMLGDARFWAPSPFDVYPEPVRRWSDCRHVTIRQHLPKTALQQIYGDKADSLQSDVRATDFMRFDSYDDPETVQEEELVLVLNYFERPSMDHPKGRHLVVANNQMLESSDLPGGMLPIYPVYDLKHPSSIWGDASLKHATEVQRNLNAAETDLWIDRRMHAHPRLIAEQGSLVDGVTRVPNTPGAVMQVKPSAKFTPHFLTAPALPRWVEGAPERYQRTIEDITGAHGITKGDQTGIMSGRQASVVLAADRQKWGPTVRSLARAVEHSSELALHLWREFGPTEKSIEIYGPTGSPSDVVVFFRHYIPDQVKVRIEVSSMLPYNEEIRRQQINEAWQIGAIPDLNMYWRLQRHGEMGRLLGSDQPSRARARHENEILDTGRTVPVEMHEDHAAHVDEHLERMRTSEWYELPERSRLAYRTHVMQHQAHLQNSANPVLAGNSPMPGLTPETNVQNITGAGGENLPPTMTSQSQKTSPGVNPSLEALMGGAA